MVLPDCRAVLFLSALFLFPIIAAAQAWVPEKGEGTVTLTLQDNFIKDHLLANGQRIDNGHIRTFIAFQDIDYGITDKLALDVSIPFVLSKYYGPKPHQLPVDDGKYHGNFQDVRLNLRYNLRAHPFAILLLWRSVCRAMTIYILLIPLQVPTSASMSSARALDATSSPFSLGHTCKGCMRF